MPSTVKGLLRSVKLDADQIKTVKWRLPLDETSSGVYIISTSSSIEAADGTLSYAPLDNEKLEFWINKVGTIQIDGIRGVSPSQLKARLNKFWLGDESILYIGKADCKGGLRKRVNQFYKTEIGESRPHAGGHWIKTLSNLNDLYVHFISCSEPLGIEKKLLEGFIANVSSKALSMHGDPSVPLPFANLELDKSTRKKHGITKCTLTR